MTLGNHAFDAEKEYVDREPRVIRPANLGGDLPGRSGGTFEVGSVRVGVANVQGRVFMREISRSPFEAGDEAVAALEAFGTDLILVDVHAEATSEKQAMGYHLAGRAQAVIGTHTHVPTADDRILPGGMADVSDVGMTGSADGIIGFDKEDFLDLFLGRRPWRIGVSKGPSRLSAAVVVVEVESRRAIGIEGVYREST